MTDQRTQDQRSAMAELRKLRREAGFEEVSLWCPEESKPRLRSYAQRLLDAAGRHFPSKSGDA